MSQVYINRTSHFLPNQSVSNDEMEEYLGLINDSKSKSKALVLRNNKIKTRYYAIDKNGVKTHTNAQMAALAVGYSGASLALVGQFGGSPAHMI